MTERHALSAVVQRVLPVPPEIVFDAWLDAEALAEFMCPDPGKATQVECDPRVGGRLRIVMSYPRGTSRYAASTSSWIVHAACASPGKPTCHRQRGHGRSGAAR